ncbi:hypothetical protein [Streptacidiphilus rugosus]|uniref:hypothetical protein n=1 Tax=Streptacidiphilus rugosus TaxID=405783 RepID=UPI000691C0F4|nr:hypothetical protein [Streptacidiphilus rugosus]
MRKRTPRPARTARTALAAAVLCAAGLTVAAGSATARAQAPGMVCMFDAPSGAGNLGHVGWGFRGGDGVAWTFGATENPGGAWTVPPSSDPAATGSWIGHGGWDQMLAAFRAGRSDHGPGYYTRYRCDATADSSPDAATRQAATEATNGYVLTDNNCLTKSVDIFKAYSTAFASYSNGAWQVPNRYFADLPSTWTPSAGL